MVIINNSCRNLVHLFRISTFFFFFEPRKQSILTDRGAKAQKDKSDLSKTNSLVSELGLLCLLFNRTVLLTLYPACARYQASKDEGGASPQGAPGLCRVKGLGGGGHQGR